MFVQMLMGTHSWEKGYFLIREQIDRLNPVELATFLAEAHTAVATSAEGKHEGTSLRYQTLLAECATVGIEKAFANRLGSSIDDCQRSLQLVDETRFPLLWATLQSTYGDYLLQQYSVGQYTNDSAAVNAFDRALEVFSFEATPCEWAMLSVKTALAEPLPANVSSEESDSELNSYLAVLQRDEHICHALGQFFQAYHAEDWLRAFYVLKAYPQLLTEPAEDVLDTVANIARVTTVQSSRMMMAEIRQLFQQGRGMAGGFDAIFASKLGQTLASCRQNLQLVKKMHYPLLWSELQMRLGYHILDTDGENPEGAITVFQGALSTTNAKEWEWPRYNLALAQAYARREEGEPSQNLERAIAYCRASLHFWYPEYFRNTPWEQAQLLLARLYERRIKGIPAINRRKAHQAYEEILKTRWVKSSSPRCYLAAAERYSWLLSQQEQWKEAANWLKSALDAREELYQSNLHGAIDCANWANLRT